MKYRFLILAAALSGLRVPVMAQQGGQQMGGATMVYDTRLFQLDYLRPEDAAKLISPFVAGEGGGVFEAGGNMHAITVRARTATLIRVDSILRSQDRPPPTVTLHFQVIAALDSNVRADPSIGDIYGSLRSLFKFGGYRLLAQGNTSVSESPFSLSMSNASDRFSVSGMVNSIGAKGARGEPGSVRLDVRLSGPTPSQNGRGANTVSWGSLLETGLSVPIGETVVLGSAAATNGRSAVILTVRPELSVQSLRR